MQIIDAISDGRHNLHAGQASSRPLSDGYESVGMHGEFSFGMLCGLMPDVSDKPAGDGGIDFTVPLLFTVDVKTARKAFNLIHEQGKPFADIFVLAEFDDSNQTFCKASAVGWEWGAVLAKAPVKDFGYGVENHYIPRERLRSMDTLVRRVWRPHAK